MKLHYVNRDFEVRVENHMALQWNPVLTERTYLSVRFIWACRIERVLKKKNLRNTCFIDLKTKQGHPTTVSSFILLHEKFLHLISLEQWYFSLI